MSLLKVSARTFVWFLVLFLMLVVSLERVQAQTEPPEPVPTPISVCTPMDRDGPSMCLKARDTTPLGNRIPILLIHGWNLNWPGPPAPETWNNLVSYTARVPWVAEKFKFYHVTYYSNLISVRDIGRILAELVDDMDVLDPSFAKQKLFLIGHSMGGLVARSFMQEWKLQNSRLYGGERVLRLVTLATPHHGTPMANGPSRDEKAGPLVGTVINLVDNMFFQNVPWSNYNRYDLHADSWLNQLTQLDYERFPEDSNVWLDFLNDRNIYQKKISAYGGSINTWGNWATGKCPILDNPEDGVILMSDILDCSSLLINELYGYLWNDGIVPDHSASFPDCVGCYSETLFGYNHSQMAGGLMLNDSYLFGAILGDLSDTASVGDSRFTNMVIMGSLANEALHNLRGWSDAGRDSNLNTYRKQSNDNIHLDSVDLFVSKIGADHILSFKRAENTCDKDSFFVYLRSGDIDTPLEEVITGEGYQCSVSQGYATYRTTVWAGYIKRNRIRIGFLDATSDGSGSKPMYYVRLDPV